MTQDTSSYNLKKWCRWRITRHKMDQVECLAVRLAGDPSIPREGSYALVLAHMRRLKYSEADQQLLTTLWQEMAVSSQDQS